jgi:putative FmdB family regulatory protein
VPIYDYVCASCSTRTEFIHGIDAPAPRFCPACGAEGALRKAVVAPSVHFKGSGWAKKDRSTAGASKTKAAAGGSDDAAAGASGSSGSSDGTGASDSSSDGASTGAGSGPSKKSTETGSKGSTSAAAGDG